MHALLSESTPLRVECSFMLPKLCQYSSQPMDTIHYVAYSDNYLNYSGLFEVHPDI
jgi:hypothetical protein